MAFKLEDLRRYNALSDAQGEHEEAPSPLLLFNKYRLRLVPIASLPIISNYSTIGQLGLNSEEALLIDSPIGSTKKIKNLSIRESEEVDEPMLETEENKENTTNDGGPLETSFLTLDKLQKGSSNMNDIEIAGFDSEVELFDTNPILFEDGVSLMRYLRLAGSEHFSSQLGKLPVWIATYGSDLPSVCWLVAARTTKDVQCTGITRIIGHFNERSEKLVKQLNGASGAALLNRYRSVYDGIRRIATSSREDPGEVIVDMHWNKKSSLVLLEQPDNAADCTIKIDLGWRDKRFYIDEAIFEQLFFVLNLADVLANPEKEVIFPAEYSKFDDLVKEMNELVEACSHEDNVFASNETNEEVTDKVWNIVRKCGDVKYATLLFKNFLQALTYGKIKSHVQEGNKSHLASLIRASKTCDFRMPILERLSTIEMMMEIGVESLRSRIVKKFSSTLHFPSDELKYTLDGCELALSNKEGSLNSGAASLLPISMAFATANQIFGLLNEKDQVVLPELTRRILAKFTTSMIEKAKTDELETDYTFEVTLPLLRMKKELFMNRRPRIWTCENTNVVGANVQTRIMISLELESSLEKVNSLVNASRPMRESKPNDEEPTLEEMHADYTVSHTTFSYHPKI